MAYDILIQGGQIIDGTGSKMFSADIGIKNGRITAIGSLAGARADTLIDATNKYVCPGFIDINSHSDSYWTLFNIPSQDSLIRQGVTSIIGGNSGSSIAPLIGRKSIESIRKWANIDDVNVNWETVEELFRELAVTKTAVNFGTLVGHATVRRGLIGSEQRDLTDQEMASFVDLLNRSLAEGALGLSTGLAYAHERFVKNTEIEKLTQLVSRYNGFYATYLRDESSQVVPALEEAVAVGRNTGASVQISHFKIRHSQNWPLLPKAVDLIDRAVQDGIDINFDVYPYTFSASVLYIYLPHWATEGSREDFLARLDDKKLRQKIIAEMVADSHDYKNLRITISPNNPQLVGKTFGQIGQNLGLTPEEAALESFRGAKGQLIGFDQNIDPAGLEKLIAHPRSIISSNAAGYNKEWSQTNELVHPRAFGTFPRVFAEYVKEKGILTFEQAVQKMTSLPAAKAGLIGRGVIQKRMFADITILDPEKIKDNATQENPYQFPDGINHVLVNGQLVVASNETTGNLPGAVLTPER